MKKKIDDLIAAAKTAHESADESDKARAKGYLDGLEFAKASGIEHDHDEINDIVTRRVGDETKSWEGILEMTKDEVQEYYDAETQGAIKSLLDDIDDDGEDGKEGKEGKDGKGGMSRTMAERIQAHLEANEKAAADANVEIGNFKNQLYKERMTNAVEKTFRDKGLDTDYTEGAMRLAQYDDLVEKLCKGEEVPNSVIEERVQAVKDISGVWFTDHVAQDDPRVLPGGFKLTEDAVRPGIEATPRAAQSADLTDEERAERATSSY